jgi:hypothetical protein
MLPGALRPEANCKQRSKGVRGQSGQKPIPLHSVPLKIVGDTTMLYCYMRARGA